MAKIRKKARPDLGTGTLEKLDKKCNISSHGRFSCIYDSNFLT